MGVGEILKNIAEGIDNTITEASNKINDLSCSVFNRSLSKVRVCANEPITNINQKFLNAAKSGDIKALEYNSKVLTDDKKKVVYNNVVKEIRRNYEGILKGQKTPKLELINLLESMRYIYEYETNPEFKQKHELVLQKYNPSNVIKKVASKDKEKAILLRQAILNAQASKQAIENTRDILGLAGAGVTIGGLILTRIPHPVTLALGSLMLATGSVGDILYGVSGVYEKVNEGWSLSDAITSPDNLISVAGGGVALKSDVRQIQKTSYMQKLPKITREEYIDKLYTDYSAFYNWKNDLANLNATKFNAYITNIANVSKGDSQIFSNYIQELNKATKEYENLKGDMSFVFNQALVEKELVKKASIEAEAFTEYFKMRGFLTGDSEDLERIIKEVKTKPKEELLNSEIQLKNGRKIKLSEDDINVINNYTLFTTSRRAMSVWKEALDSEANKITLLYKNEKGEDEVEVIDADPTSFNTYLNSALKGLDNGDVVVKFETKNKTGDISTKTRAIRQVYVPTNDNFLYAIGKAKVRIGDEEREIDIDSVAVPLSTPERLKELVETEIKDKLRKDGMSDEDIAKVFVDFNKSDIQVLTPASSIFPYKLKQSAERVEKVAGKLEEATKKFKENVKINPEEVKQSDITSHTATKSLLKELGIDSEAIKKNPKISKIVNDIKRQAIKLSKEISKLKVKDKVAYEKKKQKLLQLKKKVEEVKALIEKEKKKYQNLTETQRLINELKNVDKESRKAILKEFRNRLKKGSALSEAQDRILQEHSKKVIDVINNIKKDFLNKLDEIPATEINNLRKETTASVRNKVKEIYSKLASFNKLSLKDARRKLKELEKEELDYIKQRYGGDLLETYTKQTKQKYRTIRQILRELQKDLTKARKQNVKIGNTSKNIRQKITQTFNRIENILSDVNIKEAKESVRAINKEFKKATKSIDRLKVKSLSDILKDNWKLVKDERYKQLKDRIREARKKVKQELNRYANKEEYLQERIDILKQELELPNANVKVINDLEKDFANLFKDLLNKIETIDKDYAVAIGQKALVKYMKDVSKQANRLKEIADMNFRHVINYNEKGFNFGRVGKGFAVKFASADEQAEYLVSHLTQPEVASMRAHQTLSKILEHIENLEKAVGEENLNSFVKATKNAIKLVLNKEKDSLITLQKVLGNFYTLLKPQIAIANGIINFILLHKLIPSLKVFKAEEFGKELSKEYERLMFGKGVYSLNKFNPFVPMFNVVIKSHILANIKNATDSELVEIGKDLGRLLGREDEEFLQNFVKLSRQNPEFMADYINNLLAGINPAALHTQALRISPIMQKAMPWYQFVMTPFTHSLVVIKNWQSYFDNPVKAYRHIGKGIAMSVLAATLLGEGGVSEFAGVETPYAIAKQVATVIAFMMGEDTPEIFKSSAPIRDLSLNLLVKDPEARDEILQGYGKYVLKHFIGQEDNKFLEYVATGFDIINNLSSYRVISPTAGSVFASLPTPMFSFLANLGFNLKTAEEGGTYAKADSILKLAESLLPVLKNVREAYFGKEILKGYYTEKSPLQEYAEKLGITQSDIEKTVGLLHMIGFTAKFIDATLDNNLLNNFLQLKDDIEEGKLGRYQKQSPAYMSDDIYLKKIDPAKYTSFTADEWKAVDFALNKITLHGDTKTYYAVLSRIDKTMQNNIEKTIKALQGKGTEDTSKISQRYEAMNYMLALLSKQLDKIEDERVKEKLKDKIQKYSQAVEVIRKVLKSRGIEIDVKMDYNNYIKLLKDK